MNILAQIELIDNGQQLAAACLESFKQTQQLGILFIGRTRAVKYGKAELRSGELLFRALDTNLLDLVLRIANTRCVGDAEHYPADGKRLLDNVAGRARNRCDYRTVVAEQ